MYPGSLNFEQLSTVQNKDMPTPVTLASAATIIPTTFLTFVTGTVQVANITPPIQGCHMIVLMFTDVAPGLFLTTGNVLNACQPTTNQPTICIYDPIQKKYYVCATNLT